MAAAIASALLATPVLANPSYQVIHSFDGAGMGAYPNQLVGYQAAPADPTTWALYGTTVGGGWTNSPSCGGVGGCGVVFKLMQKSGGKAWVETRLHIFQGGTDGSDPVGALAFDASGALYGATYTGGTGVGYAKNGTVFQLTPPLTDATPRWSEHVLRRFIGSPDATGPDAGVVLGGDGAIYGTSFQGGKDLSGTVFQLTPEAGAMVYWKHRVLHSFSGNTGGGYPQAAPLIDGTGALYGTVSSGAKFYQGAVYKLEPPPSGKTGWTETVLHNFSGPDGSSPSAALIADRAGNLYGTTGGGGANGYGTVFMLSPPSLGSWWTETVLYSFAGATDGGNPSGPLLMDATGALYGATANYGNSACEFGEGCGVVYKLTPPAVGMTAWTQTVLHAFADDPDGAMSGSTPVAGLVIDPAGALYGTTYSGGIKHAGTVFRITQ